MTPERPASPGGGPLLAYLEVAAAASLWGSSGLFAEALFARGVPAQSVALLRPVVGGAVLLGVALLARRGALWPGGRGLLVLAGGGGLVTAVFQLAYQESIAAAGVPATVALLYLAPAFVLALSGPLLREWPDRGRVALAALSVAGVWLVVSGTRGERVEWSAAGVGWGVLAGAAFAAYTLFGRVATPRWGSFPTVLHSTLGAVVVLGIALPLAGHRVATPSDASGWAILLLFGLLTIAAATWLYYDALGRIEAGRAAIASTLEPVVAAVLATVALDQGLRGSGWVGLAMVVAGVAGAYARGLRAEPEPVARSPRETLSS